MSSSFLFPLFFLNYLAKVLFTYGNVEKFGRTKYYKTMVSICYYFHEYDNKTPHELTVFGHYWVGFNVMVLSCYELRITVKLGKYCGSILSGLSLVLADEQKC